MKTGPALALAALAVGVAGAAAPALAASPRAACPTAASGTSASFTGVVVKPETPAAKPTPSPRPATGTVTATAAKPAKAATLEIRVVKVTKGGPGTRSMERKSYTVVDCSGSGAGARRNDKVTVDAFRVKGDSHRLYASKIVITRAPAKPAR